MYFSKKNEKSTILFKFFRTAGLTVGAVSFFIISVVKANDCSNPVPVNTFPFISNNLTTCGQGANYNSTNVCFNTSFDGQDVVYTFTPQASMCINVEVENYNGCQPGGNTCGHPACNSKSTINGVCTCSACNGSGGGEGTTYSMGVALLEACPENAGSCVAYKSGSDRQLVVCGQPVEAGKTYYIIISSGANSSNCNGFDLIVRESDYCPNEGNLPDVEPIDCGYNLGFESGNFSGWQACTYSPQVDFSGRPPNSQPPCLDINNSDQCPQCPDPYTPGTAVNQTVGECQDVGTPDIIPTDPRVTLTSGNGTDPNTDNNVPLVAPQSGNYSVRLGNQNTGWQAECMWNTFTVDENNWIFVYQYAIVLQDPINNPHGIDGSPRFEVTITDASGNLIGCGERFRVVSLEAECNGFKLATNPACGPEIYYKNWTPVGTDLSAFMNQQITVKFCTADCGQGGHYGYAYVDAFCQPPDVQGITICSNGKGDVVTLSAPPGFKDYTWYEGPDVSGQVIGSGNEISITDPEDSSLYTVEFESITGSGCKTTVTDTVIVIKGEVFADTTICRGKASSIQLTSENNHPELITAYRWFAVPDNGFTSSEPNPVLTGTNIPSQTTNYVLEFQTSEGCSVFDTVTIQVIECGPVVEVNSDTICEGECTDILARVAVEGEPPYTFLWSDPQFNDSIGPFNVCPTSTMTYSVTLIDAVQDSSVASGRIVVGLPPQLQTSKADATCGNCDGSVEVSVTGGGSGPYTYNWNTGITQTQLTGLCPGNYSVTVTTPYGCEEIASASVANLGAHEIEATTDSLLCADDSDGTVAVYITSDVNGPYTYLWDASAGNQTDSVITGLQSGSYLITVTNSVGCIAIDTAYVFAPPPIIPDIDPTDIVCYGEATGSIDLSVNGGTTPYLYQWNDANNSTTEDLSGLGAGQYAVTVTDANGCTDTISTSIVEPGPLTLTIDSGNTCFDTCLGRLNVTAAGGTPPYIYKWDDPAGQATALATGLCAGTYIVTVMDANGCTLTDTSVIEELYPPESQVWNFTVCPGERLELAASDGGISYEWFPAAGLNNPRIQHPMLTVEDFSRYTVKIIGENGCSWIDTVNLGFKFGRSYTFFVPNAFSPNEDGQNDLFKYNGVLDGIVSFKLSIWNRWGEKIFETTDVTEYWNGRYENTGKPVKDGAYVYIVKLQDDCAVHDETFDTRIGWVVVVK